MFNYVVFNIYYSDHGLTREVTAGAIYKVSFVLLRPAIYKVTRNETFGAVRILTFVSAVSGTIL